MKEDWRTVIGELALDIQVGKVLGSGGSAGAMLGYAAAGRDGYGSEDVVVLGEQTLFVLSDAGRIRMQRRLDYLPVCMHLYAVDDRGGRASSSSSLANGNGGAPASESAFCNILVGSSTGVILIYRELDLVWSAKCDFVNVGLRVSRIGGVPGLIVGLGDAGQLDVNFIGTDPPAHGGIAAAAAGMDADGRAAAAAESEYEQMDNEHRQLLARIRERCAAQPGAPGSAPGADAALEKLIVVRAQVPPGLDDARRRSGDDGGADGYAGRSVTVRLYVSGTGRRPIEELSVLLSVAEPFVVLGERRVTLGSLGGAAEPPATLSVTVGVDMAAAAGRQRPPRRVGLRECPVTVRLRVAVVVGRAHPRRDHDEGRGRECGR